VSHVARMEAVRIAYTIFVGMPKEDRPLRRSRRRWDDIRLDFAEIDWEGVSWIHLVRDRDQWRAVVSTVMKPGVP